MGQKGNPTGFRTGKFKKWQSIWYASKREFGSFLVEDQQIRKVLMQRKCMAGTASIIILRMSEKVEITIHTARPGLVIGKRGAEIDSIKMDLRAQFGKEVWVEVVEVKRPDLEAVLLAQGVARQLERRMPFRRVMKKTLQAAMDSGAHGVKVMVSGRVGGAEIARSECYKEGRIPLHTLRADIDYGTAEAHTTYGIIGVKVWVNRGENYNKKGI